MSQFGMQMPAGRKRAASPDVYTGLALIATVFLGAAVAIMWGAAGKVAPKDGSAWSLQDPKKIEFTGMTNNGVPGGSGGGGAGAGGATRGGAPTPPAPAPK